MAAHGSAFPVAKLALNNSVPPILIASLRMGLVLIILLPIWRFRTPDEAVRSANKIFAMYLDYRDGKDFIGMDMCRKFLEMGFTRARRYANHNSGRKYKRGTREILPQEEDCMTSKYAESARIFKHVRDIVAKSDDYVRMRKQWRSSE